MFAQMKLGLAALALGFLTSCSYSIYVENPKDGASTEVGQVAATKVTTANAYYDNIPYYMSMFADVNTTNQFSDLCGQNLLDKIKVAPVSRAVIVAVDPRGQDIEPKIWMPLLSISKNKNNECSQSYAHRYIRPRIVTRPDDRIVLPMDVKATKDSSVDVATFVTQAAQFASLFSAGGQPVQSSNTDLVGSIANSALGQGLATYSGQVLHYGSDFQSALQSLKVSALKNYKDRTFTFTVYGQELGWFNEAIGQPFQIATMTVTMEWKRSAIEQAHEDDKGITFNDADMSPTGTTFKWFDSNGTVHSLTIKGYLAQSATGQNLYERLNGLSGTSSEGDVRTVCQDLKAALNPDPPLFNSLDVDVMTWTLWRDAPIGRTNSSYRHYCLDDKAVTALTAMGISSRITTGSAAAQPLPQPNPQPPQG